MDRRNFMKAMLAAGMAPAIVRADSIMRINPDIWVPPYFQAGTLTRMAFLQETPPAGWELENFNDSSLLMAQMGKAAKKKTELNIFGMLP